MNGGTDAASEQVAILIISEADLEALGGENMAMYIKSGNFNWHDKQEGLVMELSKLTANHCCFCDILPVSKGEIRPTVEHFRPKSKEKFPHLAFSWENLFLCCDQCQSYKLGKYDILLLKPDEPGYEFEQYFDINFKEGTLQPRSSQNDEQNKRAAITIDLYGLNKDNRPTARKRELKKYVGTYNDKKKICELGGIPFNLDDYPSLELEYYSYRFYIWFYNEI